MAKRRKRTAPRRATRSQRLGQIFAILIASSMVLVVLAPLAGGGSSSPTPRPPEPAPTATPVLLPMPTQSPTPTPTAAPAPTADTG
jgi:hypothetical protein